MTAEYVYRFEPIADFDPTVKPAPEEMKLSALAPAGPNTLLVLERTDRVAKLYLADLARRHQHPRLALGRARHRRRASKRSATRPTTASPCSPKSLVVDLSTISEMPDKIEGVAIVDRSTVAVANDNDFDIGNFDASGKNVGQGLQSKILLVTLPRPLP